MTPKRKQKLFMFLGLVSLAAIAVGLTLYALRANINLFFSPIQIAAGDAPYERQIRAGGIGAQIAAHRAVGIHIRHQVKLGPLQ